MALVNLSDYGDIENDPCVALAAVAAATQVVVSDDPDDFYDGTPCNLGRYIAGALEVPDNNYRILVIDTASSCVGWITKPADPVYDSTVLKPWNGIATITDKAQNSGTCGVFIADPESLAELELPYSSVATKTIVFWTVLWYGAVDVDACDWYPHYGESPIAGEAGVMQSPSPIRIIPLASGGYYQLSRWCQVIERDGGVTDTVVSAMVKGTVGKATVTISAFMVAK